MRAAITLMVAVLVAVTAPSAPAADIAVGDRTLKIAPIADHCALDPSQPVDAQHLELMADMQRGYNQLVDYWAECRGLTQYRNGQSARLIPYVLILAQLSKGGVVPADRPIGEYLDQVKQELAESNGGQDLVKDSEADIRQRFDEALARLNASGADFRIGETRLLGVLGEDEVAIYIGLLQRQFVDGSEHLLGGIVAMTELNGLSASVNVYDRHEGPQSFDLLRQRARDVVVALVAANPTTPRSGFDWFGLFESGVGGAVAGVVIAGVIGLIALVGRRRRRT